MGEVTGCLFKRLGITHLWTSAYHLQTDAKCERVHFSVHNMVTKLVGDKHEKWSHLLVALVYNVIVHSTTGYSPHELFYSFAPACLLDAMVSAPALEPAGSADVYALQAFEWLQEVAAFVCTMMGKQMERIKRYYDASVKSQKFEEGHKVLLFNPEERPLCQMGGILEGIIHCQTALEQH